LIENNNNNRDMHQTSSNPWTKLDALIDFFPLQTSEALPFQRFISLAPLDKSRGDFGSLGMGMSERGHSVDGKWYNGHAANVGTDFCDATSASGFPLLRLPSAPVQNYLIRTGNSQ
jgi:hypothetical protein